MVTLKIRLDWSEMDMFQHINNVSYFKFTQANRIKILELVGLIELHQKTNVGPTLANTSCKFVKPLFYPGNVTIKSSVREIKNTSFIIVHELYDDKNNLCAEALDIIVVYDYNKEKKEIIPENIRQQINKLIV
ncbi:MAG: acyl-CoA thioesterase [Flavobacteriales bacterium]|nr:acyl-CoA thioesterase [Flavobacteriales bacterium]